MRKTTNLPQLVFPTVASVASESSNQNHWSLADGTMAHGETNKLPSKGQDRWDESIYQPKFDMDPEKVTILKGHESSNHHFSGSYVRLQGVREWFGMFIGSISRKIDRSSHVSCGTWTKLCNKWVVFHQLTHIRTVPACKRPHVGR